MNLCPDDIHRAGHGWFGTRLRQIPTRSERCRPACFLSTGGLSPAQSHLDHQSLRWVARHISPGGSNSDKTSPEVIVPVHNQGQRTEQDKSGSTIRLFTGSNDIRTLRPPCIAVRSPEYIGDTNAKKTILSHHIMPISQGDVDTCSTLHGGNKTARELAPTLRGGFSGRFMPRCENAFTG